MRDDGMLGGGEMSESNAQAAEKPAGDVGTVGHGMGGDDPYGAVLAIDHPNFVSARRELTLENGTWRYVMVVFTDLPLDPNDPGHDPKNIDSLTQAVMKAARKNRGGYNVLTIRNP